MRNLVLAQSIGIWESKSVAVVIVYADHPGLPFPNVLQSDRWKAFNSMLRTGSKLLTVSYQNLLKDAIAAAGSERPTWLALRDWITAKVVEVGGQAATRRTRHSVELQERSG
jgi:hypothetical protein